MQDQAYQLRRLIMAENAGRASEFPPKFVAMVGGTHQVGSSTVAVATATRMALKGQRVLLIDGDLHRGAVDRMTGIEDHECSLRDVLDGNTRLWHAFQPGPGGLLVLPAGPSPLFHREYSDDALAWLFKDTMKLAPLGEWMILDCGHGDHRLLSASIETLDRLVVTTTVDEQDVMQTYGLIKGIVDAHPQLKQIEESPAFVTLVVNGAESELQAEDVATRIQATTKRFLDLPVGYAGWLPNDNRLLEFPESSPTIRLLDSLVGRISQTEGRTHVMKTSR